MSQSALLALRITSDLASMRNAAAIADEHPEDARNQRCADALRALADVIEEDHDQSLVVDLDLVRGYHRERGDRFSPCEESTG